MVHLKVSQTVIATAFITYLKYEFLILTNYLRGAPGNVAETEAIMEKREDYQFNCPYDLDASHWQSDPTGAYSGSFFKQDSKFLFDIFQVKTYKS